MSDEPGVSIAGPNAWWNPLSTEFLPNLLVRPLVDAAIEKRRQLVDDATERLERKIYATVGDPLLKADELVGPSWGYHEGKLLAVAVTMTALGVGAIVVHRRMKKKRRR